MGLFWDKKGRFPKLVQKRLERVQGKWSSHGQDTHLTLTCLPTQHTLCSLMTLTVHVHHDPRPVY